MQNTSPQLRILLPVSMALMILLCAFVYNDYTSRQEAFSSNIEHQLEEVQKLFDRQVDSEVELLDTIIEGLRSSPELQNAWLNQDRDLLFEKTAPLLKNLGTNHRITHFYFHNPDQTSFLRVYDPKRYGDKIERYTLDKAARTGEKTAGIELGKLGTLTLRVVHPWKINGKILGYIEMGEEIDHIIEKLHSILNVEMYISIYKEFLNQESWEAGMKLLNRPNNWGILPSVVIVGQSLSTVPQVFEDFLAKGQHPYMEMAKGLNVQIGSKTYRLGVVPLFDGEEREVGDIIVLFDVTNQLAFFKKNITINGAIWAVVGLILFILLSTYLRRVTSTIHNYNTNLEEMVKERTHELTEALDEIRTLRGIIPICCHCKKIRDDAGLWNKIESYVSKHSYAEFSHGVCPECYKDHYQDELGPPGPS
nr:hypothetical protein [Desulfobulbaceae bacterium]